MTASLVADEQQSETAVEDIVVGAIIPIPVKLGGGVDWAVLQVGCISRSERPLVPKILFC